MNTKVIVAFNRVEKDTPDFFKFRSIKRYFNANRISYYDVFNIVKLYDHSNNDYSSVENLVFESNIKNAQYFVTDASLNKKVISAIRLFLSWHTADEVRFVPSAFTDEIFKKAIELLKQVSFNTIEEITINDDSSATDIANALICKKVNAEGKYKDLF